MSNIPRFSISTTEVPSADAPIMCMIDRCHSTDRIRYDNVRASNPFLGQAPMSSLISATSDWSSRLSSRMAKESCYPSFFTATSICWTPICIETRTRARDLHYDLTPRPIIELIALTYPVAHQTIFYISNSNISPLSCEKVGRSTWQIANLQTPDLLASILVSTVFSAFCDRLPS